MKGKITSVLQFIANPRLLLCVALAWLITNGWSYVLLGLGSYYNIPWMTAIAGAYVTFLWLPVSPEKIVTFAIAIALLRLLFPHDQKTLAVLREFHKKAMALFRSKRQQRRERRQKQQEDGNEA